MKFDFIQHQCTNHIEKNDFKLIFKRKLIQNLFRPQPCSRIVFNRSSICIFP